MVADEQTKPRRPRGAFYESTEEKLREAMRFVAEPGKPPDARAWSLAATAVAPLLGCSTFEATRFLERARYLLEAGEIVPDLLRRMNPNPAHRRPTFFGED